MTVFESSKRIVRNLCLGWTTIIFMSLAVLTVVGVYVFERTPLNETIVWISGCLITLIMFWLAFVTYVETRRISENLYVSDFIKSYGSDKMLVSLRLLRGWVEANKDHLEPVRTPSTNQDITVLTGITNWLEDDPNRKPWTARQDEARRFVKFWYLNVLYSYKNGLISKKSALFLFKRDGFTLLFQAVEPMEYLINVRYDFKPFREMMEMVGDKFYKKAEERSNQHVAVPLFLDEE